MILLSILCDRPYRVNFALYGPAIFFCATICMSSYEAFALARNKMDSPDRFLLCRGFFFLFVSRLFTNPLFVGLNFTRYRIRGVGGEGVKKRGGVVANLTSMASESDT